MATYIKGLRLKIGEGIAGWVAQTEKPLICSDPYADPRFSRHFDDESGFRTRSILCVPLKSRDRLVGVVEVINKQEAQGFTEEDLEVLTMLGNMIGPALENAQLYSRLKEKLSLTQEELKVVEKKLLQTERLAALGKLSRMGKIVIVTALLQESPKWNRELAAAPALKGREFPVMSLAVSDAYAKPWATWTFW